MAKLNSAGTVQWAKRWGQTDAAANLTSGDRGVAVDTDAGGNVFVLGSRQTTGLGQIDFGYDILKFSASGSLASGWPKFINTKAYSAFEGDLAVAPSGNVLVTGQFYSIVDFDPAPNKAVTVPGIGAFVLSLTSAGNFGWVSSLTNASGKSLAVDRSGNAIFSGYYSGQDSPPISNYRSNSSIWLYSNLPSGGGSFIVKLNSGGGFTWAKGFANNSDVPYFARSLATDAAGNIYAAGNFRGTIDLDPGAGTLIRQSVWHVNDHDSDDAFVIKLTSSGNLAWAETFGANYNDIAYGIAVDPMGTIHLAGGYSGVVDFDPDPFDTYNLTNTTTSRHIFLVRLRQN